jgi:hypothetical protein
VSCYPSALSTSWRSPEAEALEPGLQLGHVGDEPAATPGTSIASARRSLSSSWGSRPGTSNNCSRRRRGSIAYRATRRPPGRGIAGAQPLGGREQPIAVGRGTARTRPRRDERRDRCRGSRPRRRPGRRPGRRRRSLGRSARRWCWKRLGSRAAVRRSRRPRRSERGLLRVSKVVAGAAEAATLLSSPSFPSCQCDVCASAELAVMRPPRRW